MDNVLTDSKKERQKRKDAGGKHLNSFWYHQKIYAIRLNGETYREFLGIRTAFEEMTKEFPSNNITYNGIWQCVMGKQRKHGGFYWKSPVGTGSGLIKQ